MSTDNKITAGIIAAILILLCLIIAPSCIYQPPATRPITRPERGRPLRWHVRSVSAVYDEFVDGKCFVGQYVSHIQIKVAEFPCPR